MCKKKIFGVEALKYSISLFSLLFAFITVSGSDKGEDARFTSSEASIRVNGTSTLHDWEMKSEKAVSEARFIINNDGEPEDIEAVVFRLSTNELKSDRSGLEPRAYHALKANDYPEIVFRTNGGGGLQKSGDAYHINSGGELTIAGVTRKISVSTTCINSDVNRLVCSGSKKLKMSDFDIDPPVVMLGALRTGDEITVSYEIVYTR